MYPGSYAIKHPDRAAFIMASSGEAVSYAAFERRSNQLAHLLRDQGLKRLDHYAIFMENNDRYLESCAAGERSGLYYTCVNSFLKADELAYILQNSQSQALITSYDKLDLAVQALEQCPLVRTLLVCGPQSEPLPRIAGVRSEDFAQACQLYPDSPIADESLGTPMLYSSGTTGRPKGILRPLPDQAPSKPLPLFDFLFKLWRYREDMMVLSPAPLYHAAPQAAVSLTIRAGGTVVIMEKFDPL
ncbi:MAG: acyl-CoA synthetase, partial [Betaproteobacteria bacterium]|nr:acyl-CoA synthetase [Betaproteobacteria bacterium]